MLQGLAPFTYWNIENSSLVTNSIVTKLVGEFKN